MPTVSLSSSAIRSFSLCNNTKPTFLSPHRSSSSSSKLLSSTAALNLHHPLRFSIGEKKMVKSVRRNSGAVCYSAHLGHSTHLVPRSFPWISAISSVVLMFAKGTGVQKSFLLPLFALQAPAGIIAWMKGEYGIWAAFLAILVRLFFFIPGELELPYVALLLVIVAPHQVMRLRGTQEGNIISVALAGYLAFQHFSRAGSMRKAFDQGSIVATIGVICVNVVACLLLI